MKTQKIPIRMARYSALLFACLFFFALSSFGTDNVPKGGTVVDATAGTADQQLEIKNTTGMSASDITVTIYTDAGGPVPNITGIDVTGYNDDNDDNGDGQINEGEDDNTDSSPGTSLRTIMRTSKIGNNGKRKINVTLDGPAPPGAKFKIAFSRKEKDKDTHVDICSSTDVPAGGSVIDQGAGGNRLGFSVKNKTGKTADDITVIIYNENGLPVPNIVEIDVEGKTDDVDDNSNGQNDEGENDNTDDTPGTSGRSIFRTSGVGNNGTVKVNVILDGPTPPGTKIKILFSREVNDSHYDMCAATEVPAGGVVHEYGPGSEFASIPVKNKTGEAAQDVTVTIYHDDPDVELPDIESVDIEGKTDDVDDDGNGQNDDEENDNTDSSPGKSARSIIRTGSIGNNGTDNLLIKLSGPAPPGTKFKIAFSRDVDGVHYDICEYKIAQGETRGGAVYDQGAGSDRLSFPVGNKTGETAKDVTVTIYHDDPDVELPDITGVDIEGETDDVDDNGNGKNDPEGDEAETDNTDSSPGSSCRTIIRSGGIGNNGNRRINVTLSGPTPPGTKFKVAFSREVDGFHYDMCVVSEAGLGGTVVPQGAGGDRLSFPVKNTTGRAAKDVTVTIYHDDPDVELPNITGVDIEGEVDDVDDNANGRNDTDGDAPETDNTDSSPGSSCRSIIRSGSVGNNGNRRVNITLSGPTPPGTKFKIAWSKEVDGEHFDLCATTGVPKGGADVDQGAGSERLSFNITNNTGRAAKDVTVTIYNTLGHPVPDILGVDLNGTNDDVDDNNNGRNDEGENDNTDSSPGSSCRTIVRSGSIANGSGGDIHITLSGPTPPGTKFKIAFSKEVDGEHFDICASTDVGKGGASITQGAGGDRISFALKNKTGKRVHDVSVEISNTLGHPVPNITKLDVQGLNDDVDDNGNGINEDGENDNDVDPPSNKARTIFRGWSLNNNGEIEINITLSGPTPPGTVFKVIFSEELANGQHGDIVANFDLDSDNSCKSISAPMGLDLIYSEAVNLSTGPLMVLSFNADYPILDIFMEEPNSDSFVEITGTQAIVQLSAPIMPGDTAGFVVKLDLLALTAETTNLTMGAFTAPVFTCPGLAPLQVCDGTLPAPYMSPEEFSMSTGFDMCGLPLMGVFMTSETFEDPTSNPQILVRTYQLQFAGMLGTQCSQEIMLYNPEAFSMSCPPPSTTETVEPAFASLDEFQANGGFTDPLFAQLFETLGGEFFLADEFPAGTDCPSGLIRVYAANLACGAQLQCDMFIGQVDLTAPEMDCPEDIQIELEAGDAGAIVDFEAPYPLDECPDLSLTLAEGMEPGSFFPLGATVQTYVATDPSGNTSACSFQVVLSDASTACSLTTLVDGLTAIVNPSGTSVSLSWNPVEGAAGYQVQGRPLGATAFASIIKTGNTANVGALNPELCYEWRVRAGCDPAGNVITPFSDLNVFCMGGLLKSAEDLSDEFDISVYPNPASDYLNVALNSTEAFSTRIDLLSTDGRVLNSIELPEGALHSSISVKDYTAGIYLLRITQGANVATQKIMISK